MNRRVRIEICVGDITSALAAEAGGADRVELCDNLAVGGTTPSAGTVAETCRRLKIPVHILIRPRAGDFVYAEPELAVMSHDIEVAKTLGCAGVVLGVLMADGTVDRDQCAELIARARPMRVTFHKAFDQTIQPLEALETLIDLGVERLLTSGCCPTAFGGAELIAKLVERAGTKIIIMAGGRLNASNLETVIRQTSVSEVHIGSAVSQDVASAMHNQPRDGSDNGWTCTDSKRVAQLVALVQSING